MTLLNQMQNLVENLNAETLTLIDNADEFIPIYETDKGEKDVNGRELHQGLGVQQKFTDWIKNSLTSVDATKKEFFLLKGKTSELGGRPTEDYILKLEIAKEICLVAGASPRANEQLKQKSKAYRKYLIQFEERYKQQPQITATDDTKQLNAQARLKNAKVREANTYLKIAETVGIEKYKQIMCTYASKALSGQELIPLPKAERKTYSATEIGEMLGISANKVGSLANKYNLKTKEYGLMVWDKSRHSNKQVETFRYYDTVIEPLKRILERVVPLVK